MGKYVLASRLSIGLSLNSTIDLKLLKIDMDIAKIATGDIGVSTCNVGDLPQGPLQSPHPTCYSSS